MTAKTLADQVIDITQEYLGPTADRFVTRLINFHLKKEPAELKPGDIKKLSEWIKVSLGLLTEDKKLVDECEKKILKLVGAA
jgi:hypothetical protein